MAKTSIISWIGGMKMKVGFKLKGIRRRKKNGPEIGIESNSLFTQAWMGTQ